MKSCISCNAKIEEEFNFCKTCGSNQNLQSNDLIKSNTTYLIILCILTIVGSLFGIVRGWIYELVSSFGNDGYFRGWIYIITNVGTLVGAIMMLKRNKSGLHIYTISQIAYVLTVIYATIIYESSDFGGFALLFSMLFLAPSIVFLILYWQNNIIKYLY